MPDDLTVTWASFFETFPLYKKWKTPTQLSRPIPLPAAWSTLPKLPLTMLCEGERHQLRGDAHKTRTFKMVNDWGERVADASAGVFSQVARVAYACADCGTPISFLVEFGPVQTTTVLPPTPRPLATPAGEVIRVPEASPPIRPVGGPLPPPAASPGPQEIQVAAWVRKVGQCPPWWPEIGKELERALVACGANNYDSYKKALACEGESFGMGAFGYYRSIVERVIESLKAVKRAMLSEDNQTEFEKRWQEAERDGSTRITLVSDMLPEELRVDGGNPLGYLYARLSIGLHGGKDEECMDEAEELRSMLLEVVMSLQRERERKATADRMRARREKAKKDAT